MKTIGRISLMLAVVTVLTWSASSAHGQTISFGAAPTFPAGISPTSVATGVLTGSGRPDVAVTNQNGFLILLNDGNGGLVPGNSYVAGTNPQSIVIDDFDGNGKNDLAVVSQGSGTVSIFLGNGDGSFAPGAVYAAGINPRLVLTGDLNGDGKLDLVVVDSGTGPGTSGVSILLGNGDGSFQSASFVALGSATISATIGDFNGDGKADLAAVNQGSDNISIMLGKGDGTFQAPVSIGLDEPGISVSPTSIVAGDFNKDGKLDLAVATPNVHDVAVLVGNGNGTFGSPIHYALDDPNFVNNINKLSSADLNSDGYPDLVLDNLSSNHVTVLLNHGDGTFPSASSYAAGPEPIGIAIADFNGDGFLDVIVADNAVDGEVALLAGNGNGTLQAAPLRRSGFAPSSLAVGDFNGDGKLDLVTISSATLTISGLGTGTVMLGNADGTFQAPKIWSTSAISAVAVGDFDGDGKLDLVETNPTPGNGNLSLLLGKGDGTFQPATNYTVGTTPEAVAVADLNGDGKPDVIVANRNSGNISVLLNAGNGSLDPAVDYPTPATGTPESIAVGDFNGDGVPDIAVAISGINATSIAIFLNNGNGTFQPYISIPSGFSSSGVLHIVAADFDGDGKDDLAVTDGATLSVLLASGKTAFQSKTYLVGAGAAIDGTIVVADLNGDLKPDLVTSSRDGLAVLINTGDGGFQAPIPYAPFLGGAIAVGDFNGINTEYCCSVGDGRPDIIAADSAQDSTTTDTIAVIGNQSTGPQVTVTVQTSPTALPFYVNQLFSNGNGEFGECTAPCTYNSSFGLLFQIYASPTILGTPGVQYVFDHFSDNGFTTPDFSGDLVHDVQVLAVPTTVTVFYNLQSIPVTPVIGWPSPTAITYGTPLSGTQLDASAAVAGTTIAGTYAYSPALGTVLTAGVQTLSVTFTPTDTTDYNNATGTTQLTVNKATPTVSWTPPSAIAYGTALSAAQLDATASAIVGGSSVAVTGNFAYTPALGTVLSTGPHTLSVTLTPTDSADYTTATGTVPLTVNPASLVSLSATILNFLSTQIGATRTLPVVVTNTGTANLTVSAINNGGTNPTNFSHTSNCGGVSIAPNGTCTIQVSFTPSAAAGFSATLNITDNASNNPQSISLTGTGVNGPVVTLSPISQLTFSATEINTTATLPVVLTNTGQSNLSVSAIANGGTNASNFTHTSNCGGVSIAPNGTCTIQVSFTPTAVGSFSGTLTITDNASNSPQTYSLSGTGANLPVVKLSASTVTFPATEINTTNTIPVVLTNVGTANLSVSSISNSGSNPTDFGHTSNCGGVLIAPNGTCTIQVKFTPLAVGSFSASLNITDNAPGSPQSISVSGTGTNPPVVALSATSLSFPATSVGSTSTIPVTVTNTGTASLSVTAIANTGTNPTAFSHTSNCGGVTILPNGACTVRVSFTPSATGSFSATLNITDNATGSPQSVTLTGTGGNPSAVSLSTATLNFPATSVSKTATLPVTLTNTGLGNLTVSAIGNSGANPTAFSHTSNCGGVTIAPNGTCTIQVTFTPAATGSFTATLNITDNAPSSPQGIALSGTGQ